MKQVDWQKYQSLKTFRIQGENFSTLEEFFEEVSDVLIPGAEWGKNLDALNDILRGGYGTPDEGFIVVWKNSEVSKNRLGYLETVRQLQRRLERCHPTNQNSVRQQLRQAQIHKGPVVFDWLVEIIRAHGAGGDEEEDNIILKLQ